MTAPAPEEQAVEASTGMSRRWVIAAALFVLLLALAPRVIQLGQFVTWDELFWTHAALKFNREIEGQDWRDTYVIGQPGVVTMWLGTLRLIQIAAVSGPGTWDTTLDAGQPKYRDDDLAGLRTLYHYWRDLPLVVGVVTACAVLLAYLGLRRLWAEQAALLAGVFLALDPFYVAHSRVFALDAVLASLCLLSLIAAACFAVRGGRRWLIAGAACAGLAAVNKVPALSVVAWGAMVVAIGTWRLKRATGTHASHVVATAVAAGLAWLAIAAAVIVIAWPALWVRPIETAARIVATLATYEGSAYDAMFFAGRAGVAPGVGFYPVVALFRSSPLVLCGLVLLAGAAVTRRRNVPWGSVGVLVGFSFLYTVLLSWPATKFDRYLLPALLPLIAVSGLGWWLALEFLATRVGRRGAAAALAVVAGAALALAVIQFPYFLAYYNPLAGGLPSAAHWLPVGWGEESGQVAADLMGWRREQRDHGASVSGVTTTLATDSVVSYAGLMSGPVVRAQGRACQDADFVAVSRFDRQIGSPAARAFAEDAPLVVTTLHGYPYAWVYRGGRPCPTASAP